VMKHNQVVRNPNAWRSSFSLRTTRPRAKNASRRPAPRRPTAPRAAVAPRCTTRGPRRSRRASRRRSANSWRSAPPQRTRRCFFATHKTSFFSRARSAMYMRVGMHAPQNTSVRCGAVSCMLYNLVSDLIRIERSPCTRAHP